MSFTVTYNKCDKFENACFSVSKDAKTDEEKKSYRDLCRWHKKLRRKVSTFLPVYADTEKGYATLRLKRAHGMAEFKPRCVYRLDVQIKTVKRDDRKFANVWHLGSELVRDAAPIEEEVLELSDSDEDLDEDSDSECELPEQV